MLLEVDFSVNETSTFTVVGSRTFRCFKKMETQDDNQKKTHQIKTHAQSIVNQPSDVSQLYSCHAWLTCENFLIVATQLGEVIVCDDNAEFHSTVKDAPIHVMKQQIAIECIAVYSRGFALGGENGHIFLYKYTNDNHSPFEFQAKYLIKSVGDLKENNRVTGICISPTQEDKLICALSTNTIHSIKLVKE